MRKCSNREARERQRGIGLIEVMVSIVIAMLLVLVIYQIYEISESQKRTITAGSDAQQNAAFGMYALGRDLAIAGNGIASAAAALDQCALLRPVPVVIEAGATSNDPDSITVFFGGSASLSTPVPFMQNSGVNSYVVQGPVGFSANADPKKTDVIAAVQGATCTMSRIDPGGVAVDPATGFATLAVTPVAGNLGATYTALTSSLVNLGPAESMGRIAYTVDASTRALRTQKTPSQRRSGRAARKRRRQPQGPVRTRYRQRRNRRFLAGRHGRRLDSREPAGAAARDAAANSRDPRSDRHAQRAIRAGPGHRRTDRDVRQQPGRPHRSDVAQYR
jgi:hypothetical protein